MSTFIFMALSCTHRHKLEERNRRMDLKIIYLTVLASVIVAFHVDMTKYIQQKQLKEVEEFVG